MRTWGWRNQNPQPVTSAPLSGTKTQELSCLLPAKKPRADARRPDFGARLRAALLRRKRTHDADEMSRTSSRRLARTRQVRLPRKPSRVARLLPAFFLRLVTRPQTRPPPAVSNESLLGGSVRYAREYADFIVEGKIANRSTVHQRFSSPIGHKLGTDNHVGSWIQLRN